jgi:hypothetical protein
MIRINNFLHRQQFLELTRRWFHNRLEPGDLALLKALINYNSIWLGRVSRSFTSWFYEHMLGEPVTALPVNTKGELKDLLVQNPPFVTPRIEMLQKRYRERPERYYRETPFLGVLYAVERNGKPAYVGSTRIKRVRRIAEKGARRISEYIFEQIKQRTQDVSRFDLISPGALGSSSPEDLLDEVERAERRIGMEIQRGRLFQEQIEFVLEDVLGVKVIAETHEQARVIRTLEQHDHCHILEIEQHRGRYNATNVVFRYTPDKEALLAAPLSSESLQKLALRGMNPDTANEEFQAFVREGEEAMHIELIVTTFADMLESEIGQSMHEERLMRQRLQAYRGHLSRNVSYLMEFIFSCGISPCTNIDDIPIKVWNQYVPDYFDEVVKRLFEIPTFREVE